MLLLLLTGRKIIDQNSVRMTHKLHISYKSGKVTSHKSDFAVCW